MKEQFTPEMREAGANLLRVLDKHKFDARAALWFFYLADTNEWRLLLATPRARIDGPKKLYKRLQSILSKEQTPLQLSSLTLLDAKDPLIETLSAAIQTGPRVGGVRFSRNTVNGRFIDDAYIYRLAA